MKTVTINELAQGLAGLQVGQGLEAKFYKTGGVVVVTFECMIGAGGKPETTFRMGRKSQLRHSYKDVDDVWNILTVDNGLEPPKELVLRLWKEGKLRMRADSVRRCAVCGKIITSGYVWDDRDAFCSEECAASVFNGDVGCVNILIDDGRMVWKERFND